MNNKSKFKPYNNVIQVCPNCGQIDVSEGHEDECDPEFKQYRRCSQDVYWK